MDRDEQLKREHFAYHGWNNPPDDDLPNVPEPTDLASAQSRRAWRQLGQEPAGCSK